MDKLMDAPYIQEAERIGYPSTDDEFPAHSVADRLSLAAGYISKAVQQLCTAADLSEGTEWENRLQEWIDELEDHGSDMRLAADKLVRE